jgi:hypothetical protein
MASPPLARARTTDLLPQRRHPVKPRLWSASAAREHKPKPPLRFSSSPALPIHLPQGRAPFIQAADCAYAPGTTELASTTPSPPASMDARLPLPWRLCSSHTRRPTPCSYLQPPPLCSLRRGISSPRPTFVFPRFISSAWQGSRQAPASCSTSTSGRLPRAAAAPSATSSTPQPSTSRSSSDALRCVELAKSDHPPSIYAALCAVVKTRAPCHRRALPVVS